MPLSEDEQRILRQIEQELRSDPTFAESGYRISRGRLIGLAVGVIVGIVAMLAGLAFSAWVAFGGFVVVFILAIMLERELRVVGRERIGELPINVWLGGANRRGRHNTDKTNSDD